MPWREPSTAYFDPAGEGQFDTFADAWTAIKDSRGAQRPVSMFSGDHDLGRLNCGERTGVYLEAPLVFLFTWGVVPGLPWGDEIGMRYRAGLPQPRQRLAPGVRPDRHPHPAAVGRLAQ